MGVHGGVAIWAHPEQQQLLQALQSDILVDGLSLCRHAEHERNPAGVRPHLQSTRTIEAGYRGGMLSTRSNDVQLAQVAMLGHWNKRVPHMTASARGTALC